jgi:hypothetical protein
MGVVAFWSLIMKGRVYSRGPWWVFKFNGVEYLVEGADDILNSNSDQYRPVVAHQVDQGKVVIDQLL